MRGKQAPSRARIVATRDPLGNASKRYDFPLYAGKTR
jgi:hypothetical protein